MAREYTGNEKRVMQFMAHGVTRELIAQEIGASVATVGRIARDATDKAVGLDAPIAQGIATMVAQGIISVPYNGQRHTARETALHWLHTQVMSCLDANEFAEIRTAYKAMLAEEESPS